MTLDLSPEQMKARSQNLGHSDVLTTFTSYVKVRTHRQGELIQTLGSASPSAASPEQIAVLEALVAGLKSGSTAGLPATVYP